MKKLSESYKFIKKSFRNHIKSLKKFKHHIKSTEKLHKSYKFIYKATYGCLALKMRKHIYLNAIIKLDLDSNPICQALEQEYRDKVFTATLDAKVIALDATSGEVIRDTSVADNASGYYMTLAPLTAEGKVMVGVSGGEKTVTNRASSRSPPNKFPNVQTPAMDPKAWARGISPKPTRSS